MHFLVQGQFQEPPEDVTCSDVQEHDKELMEDNDEEDKVDVEVDQLAEEEEEDEDHMEDNDHMEDDDEEEEYAEDNVAPFETGCNTCSDVDSNIYAPAHWK